MLLPLPLLLLLPLRLLLQLMVIHPIHEDRQLGQPVPASASASVKKFLCC
jgi:hypothetical protein